MIPAPTPHTVETGQKAIQRLVQSKAKGRFTQAWPCKLSQHGDTNCTTNCSQMLPMASRSHIRGDFLLKKVTFMKHLYLPYGSHICPAGELHVRASCEKRNNYLNQFRRDFKNIFRQIKTKKQHKRTKRDISAVPESLQNGPPSGTLGNPEVL